MIRCLVKAAMLLLAHQGTPWMLFITSDFFLRRKIQRRFFIHFLARSEKTNQKRGATPKAPYIGGCKLKVAETDDFSCLLVSRDDAMRLI